MTLTSCPLTSRLHTARSHAVVLLFCLVLCVSLSVSQSLGASASLSKPPAFPLFRSSCHRPSVSLSGQAAEPDVPAPAPVVASAHRRAQTLLCATMHPPPPLFPPPSPPPCGHGWSSDTNEAPPGDNQCPPDCKRLHVCLRGPPPPFLFPTVNKPVACLTGEGTIKRETCVHLLLCVCVYSGVWTFNSVVFSAFAFHSCTPSPPPTPLNSFLPRPVYFFSFFWFRRAAKP